MVLESYISSLASRHGNRCHRNTRNEKKLRGRGGERVFTRSRQTKLRHHCHIVATYPCREVALISACPRPLVGHCTPTRTTLFTSAPQRKKKAILNSNRAGETVWQYFVRIALTLPNVNRYCTVIQSQNLGPQLGTSVRRGIMQFKLAP